MGSRKLLRNIQRIEKMVNFDDGRKMYQLMYLLGKDFDVRLTVTAGFVLGQSALVDEQGEVVFRYRRDSEAVHFLMGYRAAMDRDWYIPARLHDTNLFPNLQNYASSEYVL